MAHITVKNVDLVPGQEPDGYDEEFATSMYATFKVGGKVLAALLNKQERVLGKALGQLKKKPDALLRLLSSPQGRAARAMAEIRLHLQRAAKREMTQWAFGEGMGLRSFDPIDFDVDSNWRGSVFIDERNQEVTFKDIELSAGGTLDTGGDVEVSSRSNSWRWASSRVAQRFFQKEAVRTDRRLLGEAKALGEAAFQAGLPAEPFRDPGMMQFIKRHSTGMGWSAPYLKVWGTGWVQASLREPQI